METTRIGELCAGYGGLSLALRMILPATDHMFFAEIDKHASKVLAHRFPATRNVGDVTGGDKTLRLIGACDVLAAGTPCQDISVAGKGQGLEGQRSGVLLDVLEAVKHIRPRHFIWENVGAATYRNGLLPDETILGTVKRLLKEEGYRVACMTLSAADVGAPHLRRRVFLMASAPAAQLQTSAPAAQLLPTATVVDMGNNKNKQEWEAWCDRMRSRHGNGNGHGRSLSVEARYHPELYRGAMIRWQKIMEGTAKPKNAAALLPTPTSSMSTGPSRSGREGGPNLQTAVHELSIPNTTDDEGRLSTVFVEWMMGLPKGWVTDVPGISRTQQLKMLGNGVVPLQAAHAIHTLAQRLNGELNG